MHIPNQLPLALPADENDPELHLSEFGEETGTFKDSLRSPIHRWFKYPAGYSPQFVHASFKKFGIQPGDWVYDPFSGTGTTLIAAKQWNVNAYGVEAHSFVHWVADVKLYWEFDYPVLGRRIEAILQTLKRTIQQNDKEFDLEGVFPELVYKCYHPSDLIVLYLIREFINHEIEDLPFRDLLKLALTDTLRGASSAGTGWPYVSPRKNDGTRPPKDAFSVFQKTIRQMYKDLLTVSNLEITARIENVSGDSRREQNLASGRVKLALTSPPYLNNYDYADRTRLETYFWGLTRSWADITREYRDKLIVAATTQVTRSLYKVDETLSREIFDIEPQVYNTVQQAVLQLAERRLEKGGKKDYDLMTALYFNDMLEVIKETYRVLETGGHFCLMLADSAPYGIHIPTETLISDLALGIGFTASAYHELRQRGGKWKDNPQRHNIPLREGVVILTK